MEENFVENLMYKVRKLQALVGKSTDETLIGKCNGILYDLRLEKEKNTMLNWITVWEKTPPVHKMVMGKWEGLDDKFEAVEYLEDGNWMYSQDGERTTPTHWAEFNME